MGQFAKSASKIKLLSDLFATGATGAAGGLGAVMLDRSLHKPPKPDTVSEDLIRLLGEIQLPEAYTAVRDKVSPYLGIDDPRAANAVAGLGLAGVGATGAYMLGRRGKTKSDERKKFKELKRQGII